MVLAAISCNHKLFVHSDDVVPWLNGSILIISDEYYFVKHKFNNDDDVLKYILHPDRLLYELPFRFECQFDQTLDPSKFKRFNKNTMPQQGPMVGNEIMYLHTKIKLVHIDPHHDFGIREIQLQNYDDLKTEYRLKYKIETKYLVVVIPDVSE